MSLTLKKRTVICKNLLMTHGVCLNTMCRYAHHIDEWAPRQCPRGKCCETLDTCLYLHYHETKHDVVRRTRIELLSGYEMRVKTALVHRAQLFGNTQPPAAAINLNSKNTYDWMYLSAYKTLTPAQIHACRRNIVWDIAIHTQDLGPDMRPMMLETLTSQQLLQCARPSTSLHGAVALHDVLRKIL